MFEDTGINTKDQNIKCHVSVSLLHSDKCLMERRQRRRKVAMMKLSAHFPMTKLRRTWQKSGLKTALTIFLSNFPSRVRQVVLPD